MVEFEVYINKFDKKGEKSGWTYIEISDEVAHLINPHIKTSFRVKGFLDELPVNLLSLLPMGDGNFIIPINGQMRKKLRKKNGDLLFVKLELDTDALPVSEDLMICLEEEPEAQDYFQKLPKSYQNHYFKWVESAKTPETKANRIAKIIQSCTMKMSLYEMMQYFKNQHS
jgi:Bacteriocin-protection, YdeI or OmpD-Associated/Domain of unknown function (DUF1905)